MGRKSVFAILLSLMMLFATCVTAFAAPSPTVPSMTNVDDEYEFENDVPYSNFIIDVIESVDQITDANKRQIYERIMEELDKIQEFLRGNKPIIDYFDDDIKTKIAELLPDGFDLSTLELNEFIAAFILNYIEEMGEVSAYFDFATEYEEGENLVAMLGVFTLEDEDQDADAEKKDVTWFPLKATCEKNKDGELRVKVVLTKEALLAAAENPVALGILNEKQEN